MTIESRGQPRGLLLVGCGKMGGALLAGWLAAPDPPIPVAVVEPNAAATAAFAGRADLRIVADAAALDAGFRPAAIVFATKPQGMESVAPAFRRFAADGALAISIAAGRTIAFFEIGRAHV